MTIEIFIQVKLIVPDRQMIFLEMGKLCVKRNSSFGGTDVRYLFSLIFIWMVLNGFPTVLGGKTTFEILVNAISKFDGQKIFWLNF